MFSIIYYFRQNAQVCLYMPASQTALALSIKNQGGTQSALIFIQHRKSQRETPSVSVP